MLLIPPFDVLSGHFMFYSIWWQVSNCLNFDTALQGTQRRFPPKCTENTFRLSRVLLDLQKWILSGAIKLVSGSVVLGQLWVFSKLQGLRYHFPENFRRNFKFYRNENFSDSPLHRIFKSENFRSPFSTKNNLTWGLKCEIKLIRKSYREFNRYTTKIVHINGTVI